MAQPPFPQKTSLPKRSFGLFFCSSTLPTTTDAAESNAVLSLGLVGHLHAARAAEELEQMNRVASAKIDSICVSRWDENLISVFFLLLEFGPSVSFKHLKI